MNRRYRPVFDADKKLVDLEVDRPDSLPLRILGPAGPAREDGIAEPLRNLPASSRAGVLPVLLGAGMGHALAALKTLLAEEGPESARQSTSSEGPERSEKTGATVGENAPDSSQRYPLFAVVDKEADLLEALESSGAAGIARDDSRILFVTDADPQDALARLSHWQAEQGGLPFLPLVHPFYQRLDRPYYGFLREQLEASRKFDFWSKARLPRFRSASPRLLLITSRYFLVGEVADACARLGVEHRLLTLEDDEMASRDFVAALLREVVEFKPDAVLTLNHLGVDREGVLTDLLARLELPLASWFVDNPHLVLHLYEGLASPWLAIFTWDEDNIPSLKAQGFTNVFHLPLGTDPNRFRPDLHGKTPHDWKARVSFVGNSMVYKVAQRMQRGHFPATLLRGYRDVAAAFAASSERSVRDFVRGHSPELAAAYDALPDAEGRLAYETLLTWESTRQYRTDCVRRLLDIGHDVAPLIVGDEGWKTTFRSEKRPWRWHDALAYYNELPRFYPLSEINFNSTSMQMKGAVNQRVFDVPAAGAFVLTDWREQMDVLFEPGKEIACYRHPDEVPELARFYLDHPTARDSIIQAGRRRVLACHTWDMRLKSLLATMKDVFGR